MKVEVNIRKSYFLAILGTILVLAGIITGFAYNPGNSPAAVPSSFGHTINEVDGITCTSGQAVTRTSSGWSCVDTSSSACTLVEDSVVQGGASTVSTSIDVPSGCIGKSCKIIVSLYNDQSSSNPPNLISDSIYTYFQFTGSGLGVKNNYWSIVYPTSQWTFDSFGNINFDGVSGTNGDSAGTDIISINGGGSQVITLDDDYTTSSEISPTKWHFLDFYNNRGVKIYVCG